MDFILSQKLAFSEAMACPEMRMGGVRDLVSAAALFGFRSAVFVGEVCFDISRQPPQRLGRARWNHRVSGPRRTVPEERRVRLEVSAFHNLTQFLEAAGWIGDRGNEPFQRVYMISEVVAPDLVLGTKIPDPGLAGDLRASRTRPIDLTLPIGTGGFFFNYVRNLIRLERIANKAECRERSDCVLRTLHRYCRARRRVHL